MTEAVDKPKISYTYKMVTLGGTSASVAIFTVWAWGWFNPDYPMTAEAAASVGAIAGPAIDIMLIWLRRRAGLETY